MKGPGSIGAANRESFNEIYIVITVSTLLHRTHFLYIQFRPRNMANVVQNWANTLRSRTKFVATPRMARNELVSAKNVESSIEAMLPMADTRDSML